MARSKNTATAADKKDVAEQTDKKAEAAIDNKDNKNIPEYVDEQTDKKAEAAIDNKDNKNIPEYVDELMRLYSHYEEIWVTSKGFVHPRGVPEYLTKDAVLYKNKYYKP